MFRHWGGEEMDQGGWFYGYIVFWCLQKTMVGCGDVVEDAVICCEGGVRCVSCEGCAIC